MPSSSSIIAVVLYTIGNLFVSAGSFLADFNETHVFNQRWPPHARFHNGQTMTLSLLLSSLSMYLLLKSTSTTAERRQNIWLSAVVGSFYCTAGVCAILYPGTAWADPEFAQPVEGLQAYLFTGQVAVIWLGYLAASRQVTKIKAK